MSITSRINEMSTHIEQAYDELQGLGADLTNVNKNIENISMVLDDIYDSMPQVSGEGTSLTLDDTRVGKIKSTLKGNTSQTTYSGKNLFNIEGRYETGTGITYTKNDDGSYTLNGTANGNNFLRGVYHLNEQHTISYTSNVSNSNVIIRTRTGTPTAQTGIQDQLAVSSTSGNLTSSKQFDFVEISIVNGTTLNNFKIYIQLEKGSSVTSFEPYVGGTASPNPSYPQPVNVVSGDNEINVEGKNLFDYRLLSNGTISGITLTNNNDGSITINGTATASAVFETRNFTIGENYKLSGCYGGSSTTYKLDFFNIDNVIYPCFNGEEVSLPSNITGRVRIIIYSGTTVNNVKIYPMLSTTGGEFQPYQGNTYNIDLPVENLLQLPNSTKTTNGITATITNGKLKIVGTTTTNWFSICDLNIPLESGTYTFSYTNKKANRYNLNIKYADNTTQVIYGNAYSNTPITLNQKATITAMFSDNNTTGATFDYEDYLMIEKGSKANSYTPYGTTPIELCKIGNYQDYFYKGTGKNLLPNNATTQTINGVTFKVNDDKSVTLNGTASAIADFYMFGGSTDTGEYLYIPKGTYSISNPSSGWFYIGREKTLGAVVGNSALLNALSSQDCYFYGFIIRATSGSSFSNLTLFPMINEGTTALPYEPYGSKDKWLLHKEIGKVVLNGSENWSADGGTQGTDYRHNILRSRLDIPDPIGINNTYLSNYFIAHTINNDVGVLGEFYCNANWFIFLDKNKVYDLNGWKTWLSTNNPIVYYVLATPTTEELTYEPLITQLNLLEQVTSKENQTNISQVNNDLPFIISASALKEWQESASLNSTLSMVNPLSLGNTLNTQENNTQPIEVDNIEPLEEEENEES